MVINHVVFPEPFAPVMTVEYPCGTRTLRGGPKRFTRSFDHSAASASAGAGTATGKPVTARAAVTAPDAPPVQAHRAIQQAGPRGILVFHHDQRRSRGTDDPLDGRDHVARALRIEVGRRLIKQDEPGAHGNDPGEREALLLPTRQALGGVVKRHIQAYEVQGVFDAPPYLRARQTEVLAAKCHVATHSGRNNLRVRILKNEPGRGLRGQREVAYLLPVLVAAKYAGERGQERGFTGSGIPAQQDSLARGNVEVNTVQCGSRAARVGPPEAAQGDLSRHRHAKLRGYLARASRPTAKRSRAPVAARARVSRWPTTPARMAPEMIKQTR